ncbi:NAD-dependent epimerase/dehydratase family protein [Actinophytocola sp.]|uniref:NAD-dependent epimerase/dehydratase family protein n=1 Tax=Actinophytocola sp. TaxID=1872138 RepID=UPI003D6AD119
MVDGLLARGFDVTVLHSGRHEVEFARPVEHVHTDPHFEEPLRDGLAGRAFDLTVSMYGRARLTAEIMRGRTERFIHVGGTFYRTWVDGRLLTRDRRAEPPWHPVLADTASVADETTPSEPASRFSELAIRTEDAVLRAGEGGDYRATVVRFPQIYGPGQPAPVEWSIVRRWRDGRTAILVPADGILASTRCYSRNAAEVILGVVDHPAESAGEVFNAGDAEALTVRGWIEAIADALGARFRLVGIPFEAAALTYPYALYPWHGVHRLLDIGKARRLLGYRPVPAATGLAETVHWYRDHPLRDDSDEARRLGDTFDYAMEDRLISALDALTPLAEGRPAYAHPYRHPGNSVG